MATQRLWKSHCFPFSIMGSLPYSVWKLIRSNFSPAIVYSLHALTHKITSLWICDHQKSVDFLNISSRPGCPQWKERCNTVRNAFGTTRRSSMYIYTLLSKNRVENFSSQGAGCFWIFFSLRFSMNSIISCNSYQLHRSPAWSFHRDCNYLRNYFMLFLDFLKKKMFANLLGGFLR